MSRIEQVSKNQAQREVSEIYNGSERKLGMVPNMIQLMGNPPAVLHGYLGLREALNQTSLDPKLREKVALAVSQQKGNMSDQDLATLKAAGVNGKEIAEIVLAIVVNLFTNYFNLITEPKIDFPLAPKLK